MVMHNELVIWPERLLNASKNLDDEVIFTSIQVVACHEMAHHLHNYRMMKNSRNLRVHNHQSFQAYWKEYSERKQLEGSHGEIWSQIMTEEMGTYASAIYQAVKEVPKIFIR